MAQIFDTLDESPSHATGRYSLVAVAGPTGVAVELTPPGPVAIGRRAGHDVQLGDPSSRDHALLVWQGESDGDQPASQTSPSRSGRGFWCIIDTDSKHGTRLNGELLLPQTRYPLQHGDLIQITHWTLQLIDETERSRDSTLVRVVDDEEPAIDVTICEVRSTQAIHPSQRHFALMLECAHAIHAAQTTTALADAVLDALVHGTGLPNAAFLNPLGADGSVGVVAHRGAVLTKQGRPNLSRSLIERASEGIPVRMNQSQHQMFTGASIIELGIDEALCAPIILSGTVAGYIYLDSRRQDIESSPITADASDFAIGISQIAAMAMANLMRRDIERRFRKIEAELTAAAEAQRWVLPVRQGSSADGRLAYVGESRPGRLVSGDFFDVIPLNEHRLAVTLGDVSGKGIAASVLMTVAQGFLHAALSQHGDPARAVRELNRYVEPRCATGRFVTLWVGVFDASTPEGTLTYVDAGHGYALLIQTQNSELSTHILNEAGGMPVGIMSTHDKSTSPQVHKSTAPSTQHSEPGTQNSEPDLDYRNATTPFPPGARVIVVSDGLVEQTGQGDLKSREFGFDGVKSILVQKGFSRDAKQSAALPAPQAAGAEDEIAALFRAIDAHAGGPLADDATAVLVTRNSDGE